MPAVEANSIEHLRVVAEVTGVDDAILRQFLINVPYFLHRGMITLWLELMMLLAGHPSRSEETSVTKQPFYLVR